jgi:hypothetical protein
VSGYHSTWCCFQGDISEDKFVIGPLRNGWVLNRRTIWTTSGANAALAQILHYNNGAGVNEPPDFPFGGIGWTPTVRWATGGVGQDIGYWVQVLVLGPRGTTP